MAYKKSLYTADEVKYRSDAKLLCRKRTTGILSTTLREGKKLP